jgi:CHAT domain-containing protein/Tfp pilus assembly protein PilF
MAKFPQILLAQVLYIVSLSILSEYLGWANTSGDKVQRGAIVEAVSPGSAADTAGIQVGDVILSWSRAATPPANPEMASGSVESPFDLSDVETEQAPRGLVTLTGRRASAEFNWALRPTRWGLTVRPPLSDRFEALYQEGKQQVETKKVAEGTAVWRNASAEAKKSGDAVLAGWFLVRSARALSDARIWPEADATYADAIKEAEQWRGSSGATQFLSEWAQIFLTRNDWNRAQDCLQQVLGKQQLDPESLATAQTLSRLGIVAASQRELSKAEDFFRRALAIRRKWAPESLDLATSLNHLGNVVSDRGDLASADEFYRQALAIETKLAPASQEVAGTLNSLGVTAWNRGDLGAAEDLYRRALTIWEKLAPNTVNLAKTLINLGNLTYSRGDLAGAEEYFLRSLAIQEKLAPGGLQFATILNNLGVVAWNRGDLAAAEALYRRALMIRQKLAADSVDVAASFNNLGLLSWNRGDLTAAEGYFQQALAIYEKQATTSLQVAISLNNLGNVAHDSSDLQAAEEYGRRALAIYEKLAPDSLDVARSLNNLGNVARDLGDLKAAEEHDRRALAIKEKLAPESLTLALSLNSLGELADKRADFVSAEQYFRRSLAIREKLAPGTQYEAESLYSLGVTYRHSGKPEMAADFLCRAVDSVEKQKLKIGGSTEEKSSFGAKFTDYYRACIQSLTELQRPGEAFHILERSRARLLLAMMAERDLLFTSDLPGDLTREHKLIDAEYDRTQAAINRLNAAKDGEEVARQLGHLQELRGKQEDIAAQIRKASPRFASLQYPQPLDLRGVRDALDPGTVLLSYSIGSDKTSFSAGSQKSFLFVAQPEGARSSDSNGLSVFELQIGEKDLRAKVEAFRNVIDRHRTSDQQVLNLQGRELYDLLIKPAESLITASERILISPDGPLHMLPFAALVKRGRRGKKGETDRYLIEWKPVHTIVSATVYAELKKSRREKLDSQSVRLVAFGDPKYPALGKDKPNEIPVIASRSMVTYGLGLVPLPSTRVEVEAIAKLYPEQISKYLGEEATEERAKSIGKDVRYIHFAVHGLLDERFPLNSALAFTIPENPVEGQDNGLLQAWKVFERVRIDADLVTLSACDTALGKEMGGEGLVGLTRAFEYAGAHSVLASLWSVSDESTAALMKGFYGYLKAGKSKDEALRAAQIGFIKSTAANRGSPSELSHPFHWAAFQLTGDWR